jgi:hypothetical protein
MSLEQVHAFYKRTASDEEFRSRLQEANSKEECRLFWFLCGN